MVVPDHPIEMFRTLNGLDSDTLTEGTRYKIVTE